MTVNDIAAILEEWAPRWTAWERDNVGLQIGDGARAVARVLVTLDVTPNVVAEAMSKNVGLIISHHPILFRPTAAITASTSEGQSILRLIENRIAVYATHTNLDASRWGVNIALAERLGLSNIRFLVPLKEQMMKIAVFVPASHVDRISAAMAEAGAGVIGEYDSCSFRLRGTGTFRGSTASNPFAGMPGRLESIEEVRLEMIAHRSQSHEIIERMKAVHPYEEVAYDLYPLLNDDPNHGMGAVGELRKAISLKEFLSKVKRTLTAKALRHTGSLRRKIKRVAVCGGSGSDFLPQAIAANADVFVTADVRYHAFHSAENRIALVDAGHWETEHVVLEPLADRLRKATGKGVQVFVTQHSTNPINCY
jgi:dinuclear metal center YbgI/SA1388 family protein